MSKWSGWVVAAVAVSLLGQASPGQAPAGPGSKTFIEEGRYPKLGVGYALVKEGAYITEVVANSPASKAGMEVGDTILKVDGYTIGIIDGMSFPLQSEVRRIKGSGRFEIKSIRGAKIITVDIKVGDSSEPPVEVAPRRPRR